MIPRIPVMDVFPVVESGAYPAKAVVGEPFPVRATVFREGHDQLACGGVLPGPGGPGRARGGRPVPLAAPGVPRGPRPARLRRRADRTGWHRPATASHAARSR